MPESPEVQVFVESLYERAVGRGIRSVDVLDFRALKTRDLSPDVLTGCRVSTVLRSGKHVDIDAGRWHLIVSFGRHGWARWLTADAPAAGAASDEPPVVARVELDGGGGFELVDAGQFRSAALFIVADPTDVPGIAKLGPDPADPTFTRGDFQRALDGRRKQIKALLQEQESFAGIGNAYSDEILHVARISPLAHAADLDDASRDRLFAAIRGVLLDATAQRRGIPIDQLKAAKGASMRVHGRTGQPCPQCGGTVQDIGRDEASGQYCPTCQGVA